LGDMLSVHRRALTAVLMVFGVVAVSSCQAVDQGSGNAAGPSDQASSPTSAPSSEGPPPVAITTNVASQKRAVPITTALTVSADGGVLKSVKVSAGDAVLEGELSLGQVSWTSTGRLEPGMDYDIVTVAIGPDGSPSRAHSRFHTQDLALAAQTYPSVAPLAGETVGVGMPVIVTFDIAVQDKALFEKHMSVVSAPAQPGSWHWLTDQEVHWRPDQYWQAGTDVTVNVDVNSLPAGGGVFGQESRQINFHIGDAVVSKVNAKTDQMTTYVNGKLVRTTPITTGKPGFTTRSGIKVIMEKFRAKRMNSETVGIAQDAPDGYNIDDVEYAMRVTYSGEFLHAAPWSVASHGHANVSHGCTGMSTENAAWIYKISKRGDVVEYTGTDRPMTLANGFGDWNLSVADYAAGSALK
jgi:lipoprotein-anchoring transpeptidase ErfK/SrfK